MIEKIVVFFKTNGGVFRRTGRSRRWFFGCLRKAKADFYRVKVFYDDGENDSGWKASKAETERAARAFFDC